MAKKEAKEADLSPEAIKATLAELDASERTLFEEFEKGLKEKREKKLAGILEPLRKERSDLSQKVNDANIRIREIDVEIGKLTGKKPERERSGKQRKNRRSEEDKLAVATVIFDKLHASKKNRFAPADLKGFADDLPLSALIDLWNSKATAERKIHGEGNKRARKYFVN